jgi:hypothetical protein
MIWSRRRADVLRRCARLQVPGRIRSMSDQRRAGGRWIPILVCERGAHLTLFRVTAPRFGGRPSFLARASLKESNGRPPNRLTRHAGRGAGKPGDARRGWSATQESSWFTCQHLYNRSVCWKIDRAGRPTGCRWFCELLRPVQPRQAWQFVDVCCSGTRLVGAGGG